MNFRTIPLVIALLFCFVFTTHAQAVTVQGHISLSSDSLWFGRIEATSSAIDTIWVKSTSGHALTILSARIVGNHGDFSLVGPQFPVEASDSVAVAVQYSSRHNVRREGVLFLRVLDDGSQYSLAVRLASASFYTDPTYEFTDNLFGRQLVDALRNYVQGHTSFSYNQARDMMFGTIDKRPGDTLECPYSGKKIRAVNRTEAQSKNFNTEHTWPQSVGAENEPPKSDIHHLRATDLTINDKRANYPFGYVVKDVQYEQGGSRLGKDANGTTVFEVRDRYKGDIARGMFYFAVRYNNPSSYLNQQESALRQWSVFDTVDAEESARNTAIAQRQNRRNPFIDHPEFMERISSLSGSADFPLIADPVAADSVVWVFRQSDQDEFPVLFGNRGTDTAFVRSVEVTHNGAPINEVLMSVDSTLAPNGVMRIEIAIPDFIGAADSLNIVVRFKQGIPSKTVVVQSVSLTDVGETNKQEEILRAVPNPFSGETTVVVPAPFCREPVVRVISPLGSEVHDIDIAADMDESLKLRFRPQPALAAGLYFCRIDCGDRVFICPLYLAR